MRTQALITMLAAALAIGACGSDEGKPDRKAASAPPRQAAVRPLPEIADSPLSPGRYEAKVFRPGLTLELPEDTSWRLLGPGQSARHMGLEILAGEPIQLNTLGFHRMDWVADPRRGARTRADAVKAPADFIAWLQHHPHLDAGEPQDVEIAGVTGRMIDVTPTSPPKRVPDDCTEGGNAGVPLFFDQEEPIVYNVGAKLRFISLDVGDEPVVVEMFSFPGEQFDRVIALLDPVLQSVRFTSAR
jgi:hypothetical protein